VTLSGSNIKVYVGPAATQALEGVDTLNAPSPAEVGTAAGLSGEPQAVVAREIRPAPDRYRNALGKYKVLR
jgi:hypothetical protein